MTNDNAPERQPGKPLQIDVAALELLPDGKYGAPSEEMLSYCTISCWNVTCRVTCGITG